MPIADGNCLCRFLFILGHLLRYGLDTMEAAEQPGERAVTTQACSRVFLSFSSSPEHGSGATAPFIAADNPCDHTRLPTCP